MYTIILDISLKEDFDEEESSENTGNFFDTC